MQNVLAKKRGEIDESEESWVDKWEIAKRVHKGKERQRAETRQQRVYIYHFVVRPEGFANSGLDSLCSLHPFAIRSWLVIGRNIVAAAGVAAVAGAQATVLLQAAKIIAMCLYVCSTWMTFNTTTRELLRVRITEPNKTTILLHAQPIADFNVD